MKDPIFLIDAILDVYDNHAYQPLPDGTTFCNLAVNVICQKMGYNSFAGRTADEIIALLRTNGEWAEVDMGKAQALANQGSLLIAGLDSIALGQSHGHVAIIRPGIAVYSGKWQLVPRVINIGAQNFIARAKTGPLTNQPVGINESFVPMPKIWVLRSSL